MKAGFDAAALGYDREFTHSPIGILQRQRVMRYLNRLLGTKPLKILELNCGTGEDAIELARQGHEVVATDVSEAMLQVARSKSAGMGLGKLSFEKLDLNRPEEFQYNGNFDLIFSNFGGLNCIDESALRSLASFSNELLVPEGSLVAVVMPTSCLWERAYYLLKGNRAKAFRRSSGFTVADVNGSEVDTWYYDPSHIRQFFQQYFKEVRNRPIGFWIPPSYLNHAMKGRAVFLEMLGRIEDTTGDLTLLSRYSDHFYIELRKG